MVRLTGNFYTSAGVATCGAAVAIFPVSTAATQSTSVCSATATTTTNSTGVWDELTLAANTYDVRITSGSSVRWRRYNEEVQHTTFQTGDDGNFYLGNGIDVGHRWSTGDASNHAYVIGIGDTSQQMHITDMGAIATDWARSAGTHPELAIHSNTTPITDYMAIGNHDGTTGNIDVVGGTTLALKIAGNTEASITAAGLVLPACSDLSFTGSTGTNDIVLTNGLADALSITDGSADVVVVDTSTAGNVITLSSAVTVGADGSGTDVIFYSATAGDNMTWDASAKQMVITGTACTTALNVADGNVTIADNLTVSGELAGTLSTAAQANVTTLAGLTSLGAAGATTNVVAGDVTMYNAVNNGNPTISLGSASAERLIITTNYDACAQTLCNVEFATAAASGTANKGKFVFDVDGTDIATIDDGGIDLASGKTFSINGSDISTSDTTYTAGDGLTLTGTDFDLDAALTTVTSVYNASLKVGRDAGNLIDFATTDNKLIFRVECVNEVELVQNALSPVTSGGVALGTGSLMWSNAFLASGSVVNFNNGDVTLTHSACTLTVAGGTLAAAAITGTTIDASTDFTIGTTVITDDVVTFTPSSCDTVVMTAATNGAFSLVTTDTAAAAANIQITADGTVDIDSAGVLTLDSGAAINIEPAACSAILLDGTISVDAGVVTGATSITSTHYVTGNNGTVKFLDGDGNKYFTLAAHACTTACIAYTFPPAGGSCGNVLTTNGSGVLSWASAGGGGDVVCDTSPQLGGSLDAQNNTILNIGAAGNDLTATGYLSVGDGNYIVARSSTNAGVNGIGSFSNISVGPCKKFSFQVPDGALFVVQNGSVGYGTLFFAQYTSSTIQAVAGCSGAFTLTCADEGKVSVYKSSNSNTTWLENRTAASANFRVLVLGGNATGTAVVCS